MSVDRNGGRKRTSLVCLQEMMNAPGREYFWAFRTRKIYLALTSTKTERLRQVSYMQQLEAGYKHPGSAGLTVYRLGYAAEWHPHVVAEPLSQTRKSELWITSLQGAFRIEIIHLHHTLQVTIATALYCSSMYSAILFYLQHYTLCSL
jgi:hypothetical protein